MARRRNSSIAGRARAQIVPAPRGPRPPALPSYPVQKTLRTASGTPEAIEWALDAAGMDASAQMGPGRPLSPAIGYSQRPRTVDFPTGINLALTQRSSWGRMSFATLKALVDAYDVARMCINHKIDELRSMEPLFTAMDGVSSDVDAAVEAAKAALEFPDRELPWLEWLSKLLENALRYDATALYHRRNLGGEIIGLEVLDGTTIGPYIDEYGRRPKPPAPAYFQVIKGLPWNWYTADEIGYHRFRPQADPFGLPAMESLLLNSNTDLRFQWHFMQMFTEGSVPAGFVELPPDLSNPDQVAEWQDYWDAMVLGDQAKLHQLLAVPNGTKIHQTKPDSFEAAFPEYLMMRTCAAFGVVPQDLGLVKDVNRANGETQVDIQFRVNTLPWVLWVQGIVNRYLQAGLGLPVQMKLDTGRDKEDRRAEAEAWKLYIESGMASSDEGRQEVLGLPVDNENPTPRFIMTSTGGPVPLRSLFAIAGQVDPETGAPRADVPLDASPFVSADGVIPDRGPGETQFRRAVTDPDEPEFPALEQPVPGSDVAGLRQGGPVIGDPVQKAQLEQQVRYATDRAAAERHAFERFRKARVGSRKWRDFEFRHVDQDEAARLNLAGRRDVRKAAGDLIAAGLAVQAVDTGRVLMLQRGLSPDDPARGTWEFPGGHIEPGEDALTAACREWEEETGCLLPAGDVTGGWRSDDGVFEAFVWTIPAESQVPIADRGQVINPDDPDGDSFEAIAWWDPRQMGGDGWANPALRAELRSSVPVLMDSVSSAINAILGRVAKAGGADPKAPGWRDGASKVPQHGFDLRLTDWYAPRLAGLLTPPRSVLEAGWAAGVAALGRVVKSADPVEDEVRQAVLSAFVGVDLTSEELDALVRDMYVEAYFAGTHAAGEQLGGVVRSAMGEASADVDWSTWEPGHPLAASLVEDGGLAALLDQVDVTIRGFAGTSLDMLGNQIADAVRAGESVDEAAGRILGTVGSASRAEMIAHTEIARALTSATMGAYAANGVGEWELVLSDGACPRCEDVAAENPHRVGDGTPQPPIHPRCRCAAAPIADSVTGAGPGMAGAGPLEDGEAGAGGFLEEGAEVEEAGDAEVFDDLEAEEPEAEEGDLEAEGEEPEESVNVADLSDDDLAAMSDDDVAALIGSVAEDEAQLERVMSELDRRDEAARKQEASRARSQARRDAKAAKLEKEFDEAVNAGEDPLEAYARVYGKDPERLRIESAISSLRAAGYTGRNFEELCMSQYKEYAARSWLQAENETRGRLLNREGRAAGIDPRTLFTGTESRARKYASEELLSFWQSNGRLTLEDFKAANLGGASRAGTGNWL